MIPFRTLFFPKRWIPSATMLPTALVAYLALFATVGFLFVLVSLLLGRLLRAHSPTTQKVATYECGEPAIGPGSVQFDLRFYVVALLFLIFEVEVAFFFPPATIFGTAVNEIAVQQRENAAGTNLAQAEKQSPKTTEGQSVLTASSARTVALASMIDLGVFFAVLLVGFAFVWRRGDMDWVRAIRHPATPLETAAIVTRLREGDR